MAGKGWQEVDHNRRVGILMKLTISSSVKQ